MEDSEKKKTTLRIKKLLINSLILIAVILFLIAMVIYLFIVEIIFRIAFQIYSNRTKKKIILVTSDSPIWQDYVNDNLLPLFGESVSVLNWSQRKLWDNSKWEVKAFRHWGGQSEFNPLVIINKNLFQVKVIRLYEAFVDYKHGKAGKLVKKEMEIRKAINAMEF
jgi:predicted Holliday junction resolvase-like endonuclease